MIIKLYTCLLVVLVVKELSKTHKQPSFWLHLKLSLQRPRSLKKCVQSSATRSGTSHKPNSMKKSRKETPRYAIFLHYLSFSIHARGLFSCVSIILILARRGFWKFDPEVLRDCFMISFVVRSDRGDRFTPRAKRNVCFFSEDRSIDIKIVSMDTFIE